MTTNIEFDAVSNSWDEHTSAAENHISTGVQVAQAANGQGASEPVPVDVGSGAPAQGAANTPATNQPAANANASAPNAPATPAPNAAAGNAPAGNAPATNAAASNAQHEYVVEAGNVVKLPANVSIDDIKVDGHNLVLVQPDGSEIIIKDGALNVPTFILGDVEVPRVALIAALESSHINVAFGADGSISAGGNGSPSSAGGNFDHPAGDIGNGFGLSPLLPPTDLAFGQPEHRELFPGLAPNHAPEIDVTPTNPNPLDGSNIVDESGLPVIGSNPSDAAIHATGTIHMTDADGAGDLKTVTVSLGGSTQTVNISAITGGNSQTFDFTSGGAHGTLTITGYDTTTGNATYTYTLTNPVHDATPNNGADTVSPGDTFTLTVTDASNASGTANLVIDIKDDVPHAVADTSGIAAGAPQVTGNVESNDTPGADGYAAGGGVVGVAKGDTGADLNDTGTLGGTGVTGAHGTLVLGASGAYTYTLDPNDAAVKDLPKGQTLTDTFTYTIADGDGDLSHTTLTVTITGSNHTPTIDVTPTNPNPADGFNIVDESGLPIGSNPSVPATQATGTIHLTDPDGASDLKTLTLGLGASTQTVNISDITGAGSKTFDFTSGGAHGTVTITGYDPATGNATYTYTLTNPVHDATPNNGADTVSPGDTFALAVTDGSGTTASANLVIDIKDDVPTAKADTDAAQSGETVTGNVETGTSTHGTGAADTAGADGIASIAWTGSVTNAGITTVTGTYGVLTVQAD
ncbi:VCBS domain-containing protein, partial [Mesorhizobium sp. VK25D]